MGCIKIFNNGMSCFFSNDFGDGTNTVNIYKKPVVCDKYVDELSQKRENAKFLGHFTVKTKAYLSSSDCTDDSIYKFEKGRWFVYLIEPLIFHIEKNDECLNS